MNEPTCAGSGAVSITTTPVIPEGAEVFESADGFPGLCFTDTDGDKTSVWVKDSKSYYWSAHTNNKAQSYGGVLLMIGGVNTGEVYVCPRDRMAEDGGFHAPALAWLKQEWAKLEATGR